MKNEILKCPECDKMRAVKEKSQAIGEFLEWLHSEKDITLCRLEGNYDYRIINISTEKLLAEFFDIDLNKVEEEKRAILNLLI